jgi:hypothetical protein
MLGAELGGWCRFGRIPNLSQHPAKVSDYLAKVNFSGRLLSATTAALTSIAAVITGQNS